MMNITAMLEPSRSVPENIPGNNKAGNYLPPYPHDSRDQDYGSQDFPIPMSPKEMSSSGTRQDDSDPILENTWKHFEEVCAKPMKERHALLPELFYKSGRKRYPNTKDQIFSTVCNRCFDQGLAICDQAGGLPCRQCKDVAVGSKCKILRLEIIAKLRNRQISDSTLSPTADQTIRVDVEDAASNDEESSDENNNTRNFTFCKELDHDDIPRPPSSAISRISTPAPDMVDQSVACKDCREQPCTCDPTTTGTSYIRCSNTDTCFMKNGNYNIQTLRKFCRNSHEDFDEMATEPWICPICIFKEDGVSRQTQPKISTRFGREPLDMDEVSEPLSRLGMVLEQYTLLSKSNELAPINRYAFPRLPIIEQETLESDEESLVGLRSTLNVPGGVLIKKKIENLMRFLKPSEVVCGILGAIIKDSIFDDDSLFDDTSIWHRTISNGLSASDADMFIQDYRKQTSETTGFKSRLASRQTALVKKLNNVMLPFVDGDYELEKLHHDIADIITSLQTVVSTYNGNFEPIWATKGTTFDQKLHSIGEMIPSFEDSSGRVIIMTTTPGIQYRLASEKDWRVLFRATVVVLPSQPKRLLESNDEIARPAKRRCAR